MNERCGRRLNEQASAGFGSMLIQSLGVMFMMLAACADVDENNPSSSVTATPQALIADVFRSLGDGRNCTMEAPTACNALLSGTEVCAVATCEMSGGHQGECRISATVVTADGGTPCATATRLCEQPSYCNGSAFTCPATTPKSSGTMCRAAAPAPTTTLTQNLAPYGDAGVLLPNFGSVDGGVWTGTITTDQSCDVTDYCDGVSLDCQNNVKPNTFQCRTSANNDRLCLAASNCDGVSPACPSVNIERAATEGNTAIVAQCADLPGKCGLTATCRGLAASGDAGTPLYLCPAPPVNNANDRWGRTSCRYYRCFLNDAGVVTEESSTGVLSHPAGPLPDGAVTWDGGAGFVQAAGTIYDQEGPCIYQRVCTGELATPIAPASADPTRPEKPSTTICRAAAGSCDAPDYCYGSAAAALDAGVAPSAVSNAILECPNVDRKLTQGTLCRAANGACDLPESCDGVSNACPSEPADGGYADAGVVCRPALDGGCDIQEVCTGTSRTCPNDTFVDVGTECLAAVPGAPCDAPDVCNGAGACVSTYQSSGTTCRPSATGDSCDPAETCSGDNISCPIDVRDTTTLMCQVPASKPHILLMVDNSASMTAATTGTGTNACGKERTRMSDMKCAVQRMVQTFGDVTFGLGRFAMNTASGNANGSAGSPCPGGVGTYVNTCTTCGNTPVASCLGCAVNDGGVAGGSCEAPNGSDTQAEILVGVNDEFRDGIVKWVDYTASTAANSCSSYVASPAWNPELAAQTAATPLASSLRRAYTYYAGGDDASGSAYTSDTSSTCQRRYVILLTDGQETCASTNAAAAAATALQSVPVTGGGHIGVDTYVILFGDTDEAHLASANDIAVAGGTGRARSATNDAELGNVLSEILQEAIPHEICNGEDDDCNGIADDGLTCYCDKESGVFEPVLPTDPGDRCDVENSTHVDNNCYRGVADELCTCTPSGAEDCDNGIDDDCDGVTDSADLDCAITCATGYEGQAEQCNGIDEDCDSLRDEDIAPRDCGFTQGACIAGVQYCEDGHWTTCNARTPVTEDCDDGPGEDPTSAENDDDCDGIVDVAEDLSFDCGPTRTVTYVDEDGETIETTVTLTLGICRQGRRHCGSTECVGAVEPNGTDDNCDGLDNDCDGEVDEGYVSEACSCGDGQGMSTCDSGSVGCRTSAMLDIDDVCNNLDDDCDGDVDEDALTAPDAVNPMPDCVHGEHFCTEPTPECVRGAWDCVGAVLASPEICDNTDNDCDDAHALNNEPDTGRLCGADTNIVCASVDIRDGFDCRRACTGSAEFECPSDEICYVATGQTSGYCISNECMRLHVPACARASDGAVQQCDPLDGVCKPACESGLVGACQNHFMCNPQSGTCQPLCGTPGVFCGANETCVADHCVSTAAPDAGISDAGEDASAIDASADAAQLPRVSVAGGCASCSVATEQQQASNLFWLTFGAFAFLVSRRKQRRAQTPVRAAKEVRS